ncbi:P-loop containing nucleoside triphosphate hydrolase protein [Gautieria morchelliformis]|nr:P-loop containing nucleoside triphosphate hydrolase protein [Gautieria morchelliformis]
MPYQPDLSDDETSNSMYSSWRSPPSVQSNGTATSTVVSSPQRPPGFPRGQPIGNPANANARSGSMGLSDPALSAARRRKLDAINRLQNLGAQRDIDIPQIVVIGSQSAGKSSLIESISGITLPRASGTCTRCPTECRLIHSTEPWQCTVSLRFTTNESGNHYDSARNVQFGQVIRNPKDVEERLRRAQRAVLNPSLNPQQFLENTQANVRNALDFSTNIVSLEIQGPDVTDLSFCDLPGLIASVSDDGRDEDVEEVKELVSSYIRKESCIILLTVACETDFETQGAYRLAKAYDPAGSRTIGVLTKPDRIPEGEHAKWFALIKNERSALVNGWYCVKQPSTAELEKGLTFFEARRRGEEYFRTPPWSRLDHRCQSRLGTQAVTQKLNGFLMDMISKRFPEIMEELQAMLQQTKDELQMLPDPPSNDPILELMHLVNEISDDLHKLAEGFTLGHSRENQFEGIREAHGAFQSKIRATAPNFRTYHPNPAVEVAEPVRASTFTSERSNDGYLVQEVQVEEVYPVQSSPLPPSPVQEVSSDKVHNPRQPSFFMFNEGATSSSTQAPIYHDEVVQKILKATTRELPGYFPFHVVQDLVSCSTDQWMKPALTLIDDINQVVVEHQSKIIKSHFPEGTTGILYQTVTNIITEYTKKCRGEALARVQWLLKLESNAFTLNRSLLDGYTQKFLDFYRWRPAWYAPWDPNQSALEIMATVSAYFEVAHRRVLDTVPLAIDNELVRVQKRNLQEELSLRLRITDPDPEAHQHRKKLLAEPQETTVRREELTKRYERLIAAHAELMNA